MPGLLTDLAAAGSIASIIGLITWRSLIKVTYRTKVNQRHHGTGDNVAGDKIVNKKLFRDTQTINMLPPPLGGKDELELNGAGVIHVFSWTATSVSFITPTGVPVSSDGTVTQDATLPIGGGMSFHIPVNPNWKVEQPKAFMGDSANKITLSQEKPYAIVTVGARVFTIKLLKIRLLPIPEGESVSNKLLTAYDIGINEEEES